MTPPTPDPHDVPPMSETFSKLFSSILSSTIWCESKEVRLVWVTMLAMADRNGYVGASVPGIAAMARVEVEEASAAIQMFLEPDTYSRSKDYEGRRIEVADRGWNLLNYERFRDMRDEEARKEYERNRKRVARAKAKGIVPDSPGMSRDVPACTHLSAQAEADCTDAESDSGLEGTSTSTSPVRTRRPPVDLAPFERFWDAFDKKTEKPKAVKAWKKIAPDRDLVTEINTAAHAYCASTPDKSFRKAAFRWLRDEGWNDEIIERGDESHANKAIGQDFSGDPVSDV